MSTRPDFEKLYRKCFDRHSKLLSQIGGVMDKFDSERMFTPLDAIESIREIYYEHLSGELNKESD